MKIRLPLFAMMIAAASWSAPSARGEAPRYHWKDGQRFIYEVEIKADLPTKLETMTGHLTYEVKSTSPLKISYTGGVKKASKAKPGSSPRRSPGRPFGPGFFVPPPNPFARRVNPFKGLERTTNEITVDQRGGVLTLVGSSQLPYLLGNLSLLVFEPLPADDDSSWTVDSGVLIRRQKEQSGRGFGPFGDPFFARRFGGGGEPQKTATGGVSMSFQRRKQAGELTSYKKSYRLHSPGDDVTLTVEGDGLWTFNRQIGMSESLQLKQRLTILQDNVSVVIPFEIKYRRLTEQQWAKHEAERLAAEQARQEKLKRMAAEAKAKADAPIIGGQREQVLAGLQSDKLEELKQTLTMLAEKTPRSDESLAKAIEPHVDHQQAAVAKVAKKALAAFSPEFKKVYDVIAAYQGSKPVEQLGLWVSYDSPLPNGLIVAANRYRHEQSYYPAEVVAVLSNGLVKVKYLGWTGRTEERLREDLYFPPEVVEQPKLGDQQLAAVKAHWDSVKSSLGSTPEAAQQTEKLIRAYRDNKQPLLKTGAVVPGEVELPKYLVVAAQKKDGKWYQAHVSKVLPDGRVAVRFSGGIWDAKLTRDKLRLPPPEVKPPNLPPLLTAGSPVEFRTWKDKSGSFAVEAKFVKQDADQVQLVRKSDGMLLQVPLAALSENDRQYLDRLSNSQPKNPFQPVSP